MTGPLRGDLSDKVAIVTGATQGVGEAIARRVAEWGARGIVITGRNVERGANVVRAIEAIGTACVFVPGDQADPGTAQAVVDACAAAFGGVDCLVNAAASTERASVLDADAAFVDAMFATNVRTPLLLVGAAARLMRRDGRGGSIVNILSINAHVGAPDLAVYSASKGAMATLTRNAASALSADRIRVNGINLGWADTPAEHVVQEKTSPHGARWLEEAERTRPFGRLIQVDEIADLAAFLLSRHAGIMTGAVIDYEQWVVGVAPA